MVSNPKQQNLPAFACVGAGDIVDLWPEPPPGLTYAEANTEGRERAEQLLEVMRRTDTPAILGHVAEAISDRGRFGGVEVGFFHILSLTLMQPPVTEFVEVPVNHYTPGRKIGPLRVVA